MSCNSQQSDCHGRLLLSTPVRKYDVVFTRIVSPSVTTSSAKSAATNFCEDSSPGGFPYHRIHGSSHFDHFLEVRARRPGAQKRVLQRRMVRFHNHPSGPLLSPEEAEEGREIDVPGSQLRPDAPGARLAV